MLYATLGLLIFTLAFFLHETAKAIADGIKDHAPKLRVWANNRSERFQKWFNGGDAYRGKQGLPWTCDAWHLMDGHIKQWTLIIAGIGGAVFGFNTWLPLWIALLILILLGWAYLLIFGKWFMFLYHGIFGMPR